MTTMDMRRKLGSADERDIKGLVLITLLMNPCRNG
ncbi:MAG: hypothetical protein GPOALKHO_001720 [Sodalis sp.]|nr:MAG: hypothetical protein GPOALKHO_001720 [Sodalis sp.]